MRRIIPFVSFAALACGAVVAGAGAAWATAAHRPHGTVLASLMDPGGSPPDDFSLSAVSIDGNTAVVGADGTNFGQGAAYIYVRGENGWPASPTVTLTDPLGSNGDQFGSSVSVSGRIIVVGAMGSVAGANFAVGAAYVYVRGRHGWPSAPAFTLADPNGTTFDTFGGSVAADDGVIVVGAPGVTPAGGVQGAGAAYVYRLVGAFGLGPVLAATIPDPAAAGMNGDAFGSSVAISDGSFIAGAPNGNGDAINPVPTAYIFQRGVFGWPTAPTAKLADPGAFPSPGDGFGSAVAISDRTVIGGALGANAAYIYAGSRHGWPSTPTTTLADPNPPSFGSDAFGSSVAVDGGTAVVGSYSANGDSNGAVYTYVRGDNSWPASPASTLNDPNPNANFRTSDFFGQSVAVADGTAIGGAWDTNGDTIVGAPGAAYIFIP